MLLGLCVDSDTIFLQDFSVQSLAFAKSHNCWDFFDVAAEYDLSGIRMTGPPYAHTCWQAEK